MNGRIPAGKPIIGEDEEKAVLDVLRSGQLASGPMVKKFEEEFAEYIGVEHAVAVSSGTAAIHLSLLSAGIGKGDKVIVTPYSFVASVSPVLAVGAEPVFVDIDPETYCISSENIRAAADGCDAVLPVHLYGHPADMVEIVKIGKEEGLTVVEDACQAHGASMDGKKVGSLGDIGCFSFYATKNMTTGEGGMVTTDDEEMAAKVRSSRAHGVGVQGEYDALGYNYLMTEVEAAIGLVQLDKLDDMNECRRTNADILNDELSSLDDQGLVQIPIEVQGYKHVYNQYPLRVPPDKRTRIVGSMKKAGIGLRKGYQKPIYKQKFAGSDVRCPEAEKACEEVVWVPVYPTLEPAHMRRMAWGLKKLLE